MQSTLCIANTWLREADNKKRTHGSGCNEGEIDYRMIGKVDRMFVFLNVKAISGELEHNLGVVDIDTKKSSVEAWR